MEVATLSVVAAFVACDASRTYRATNFLVLVVLIALSASFVISRATHDRTAALFTNYGTPDQYKAMAMWINLHIPDTRIKSNSELGTIQYYTDADMINEFSDRGPVLSLLRKPHSRIAGALIRSNYRHYPTEYLYQFRYELSLCRPGAVPEMTWITDTPEVGLRHYCLYKDIP
jgi:hypothetical protein